MKVFKRAYFRAIALINDTQPVPTNDITDLSDEAKKIRISKFKTHLKRQKFSKIEHEQKALAMNQVNENLIKLSDQKDIEESNAIATTETSNNNQLLDELYAELLRALEGQDEDKIVQLQRQIASIEP